jgi:DNA-binding response OmpR family regulator
MRRVLFVDDDPDLGEAMRDILQYSGLATCVVARSLDELAQQRDQVLACTLAILDVNLGDGEPSGVDVFHWLRQRHFAGDIVFLTGHAADDPLVMAALELGAGRICKKPIGMDELVHMVQHSPEAHPPPA